MMFYLRKHQNYQKLNQKVPKKSIISSKMITLNLQLVVVFMPLEIKCHAIPHLKVLNSGLEP